ncbi:metallophosphoesterase family protein [Agromyces intestinalis]|uniref:Metallophosphoesterase family protein n=1 Tax=Agromyces intestinalis TaxID=2592652 RepID=A0A5C1YFQ7_9MICO|nr:FN3 domain-containing metallophosphoesterase family protein [Agromyces intestinalis]QEO14891.1 metallophosphoesterase family protein [Agromyces intestinalis]
MTTPALASGRLRRAPRAAIAAVGLVSLVAGSVALSAVSASAADDLPATFLSTGSTWKYSDTNVDPAGGDADRIVWTRAGYDDSAWKSGTGAFGAKNGSPTPNLGSAFPVSTVLNQYIDPNAASKVDVPTFHFRTTFDVTSAQLSEISGLAGTVVYDDAVQVFVNGTKVAGLADDRVNEVPPAQQNLTYAGEGLSDPATSTFQVPAAALQAGTNTIAIALYQDRPTSSDAYLALTSLAPVERETGSTAITDVVLGVGGDESQRMLTWYTSKDTAQVAQFAPAAAVVDGKFPVSAVTVPATGGATTSGEFNRVATLTGLAENTAYVYRVGTDGDWSTVHSFRTRAFEGDFDFLFFGDPQIGSSGNIGRDGDGWADTLDVATSTYPDAELLFSAGDQVEHAANEEEYAAFLAPDALREIPFVATNGNHDVGSKAYEQHFGTPNTDRAAGPGSGASSGGDYWFVHKGVLFIDLNSNSRDYASHEAFVRNVVAEHGDEASWKVVAFHHSIYSAGPHATDSDVKDRRSTWPTLFSELGIDLVLQGHDHSYARTYLLHNGDIANPDEQAGADTVTAGPGGVLYVTSNSASGSKYYDLQPQGFPWLSVANQEKVRNYTAVEVTADAVTVKTLRSQANGDALPVNSVVDQVTLQRATDPNAQRLQVTVPEGAPGEFVWSIDGTNGIVDLGTATEQGDHFAAAGSINPIRVTDTRRSGPNWAVSAQVGDFAAGGTSFSGKYLGWTPKVVEQGAGAIAGDRVGSGFDAGEGLSSSSTLGRADVGHSRGSAKLGADLELKIPVDVTDGTYRATLTLTALS